MEITARAFTRRKSFSLQKSAKRSFGVFQEEPFDVVWRFSPEAAADARQFLFHPTQSFEDQPDGSLLARSRARGALEMCWHLVTYGAIKWEILAPCKLAKYLSQLTVFCERYELRGRAKEYTVRALL